MLNEFIYDPYKGGFLPPKTNAGRLFVGHQKFTDTQPALSFHGPAIRFFILYQIKKAGLYT